MDKVVLTLCHYRSHQDVNIVFMRFMILLMLIMIKPMSGKAHGAILPPGFIEDLVVDSLNPTSMCMSPDGRLFLGQKDGRILVIDDKGQLNEHPLISIPTDVINERGLQGIALHPVFPDSSFIYVFYAIPEMNRNRVSRFTLLGDLAVPGSEQVIIELDPMTGTVHNGGALVFGPYDGMLYVSTGEAGKGLHSQDTTNLLGKILRLNPDGSIPESNPFYHTFTGKNKAIYALGFRNPFSMTVDKTSGLVYVSDVGSGFFEEINIIYPGRNYGWPLIEGVRTNQVPPKDYQDPLYAYPHSAGCAIVGASFYQPAQSVFPDSLRNLFFFGDYCNGMLYHVDPSAIAQGATVFAMEIHRPLAILSAPDGSIYYLAREGQGGGSQEDNKVSSDGTLWRIQYIGHGKPHISVEPRDAFLPVGEQAIFSVKALGEAPLRYQWYMDNEQLAGEAEDSLVIAMVTPGMDAHSFFCMVTNEHGADTSGIAILTVTSNTRPELYIDFPLTGGLFKAGDTLRFAGHASDAENGLLAPAHYAWRIDFHHKTHAHPALETISGVNYGQYIIPAVNETDPEVWYRIYFFATDSGGLVSAVYRDIYPDLADITLTGPKGLHMNADGKVLKLPVTIKGVKGLKHTFLAPDYAMVNDSVYLWRGYGKDSTAHLLEIIAGDTDTLIELTYYGYTLGNGSGLLGEYYDDPESDMDGEPNVIRIDSTINFKWGAGSPGFNFPKDFFTIRWTGWVTPYLDGEWTFYIRSDDGCRLWIDDVLVINEWHGQPPTEHAYTVNLEGNHNYSLRLEYLEEDGGAEVEMAWSHALIAREIIPKSQFIPARLVGKGDLEGNVWIDSDYDQEYDLTESKMEHVTLLLYRQSDTTLYAAVDVKDGLYRFAHVKEDMYILQAIYSGPDPELIPSMGAGKSGFSDPFFIQGGFVHDHPIAFSRRRGTIVGRVWVDKDNNGFQDEEESGLADVLCIMHRLDHGTFSIEQTNEAGFFTCEDVDPGLISLELANKPGINAYAAGTGLNADFTTSVFSHEIGEDHFFLLGLVPLSTESHEAKRNRIHLFPNPAGDILFVHAEGEEEIGLRIWSEEGFLILEKQIEFLSPDPRVDIQQLAAGMYFVELDHKDGSRTFQKVVKI